MRRIREILASAGLGLLVTSMPEPKRTLLRLSTDGAIIVHMNLADTTKLLQKALHERALVEIVDSDGRRVVLNPAQVVFLRAEGAE